MRVQISPNAVTRSAGVSRGPGSYFAGLDVSVETTSICVVDGDGRPVLESEVKTAPEAIARALRPYRRLLRKVGHETTSGAARLHKELLARRLPVVCLDARLTRAALAGQRNKTDRNDARDIAVLLARGLEAEVFVKRDEAEHLRTLLGSRSALKRKARDLARLLAATLRAANGKVSLKNGRVVMKRPRRALPPMLSASVDALLIVHAAIGSEADKLDAIVRRYAGEDEVCRRLMTAPGVGPLVATAFKAAIDDPQRFATSRLVGAYFGLTPRRRQSGRSDFNTGISKLGDPEVRSSLYIAAQVLLNHSKSGCALRLWGLKLKARKSARLAYAAVARKLAVILHRMWVTASDFHPETVSL